MRLVISLFLMFFAFSSGAVISGGVFAFIASIGVVPRFAQKTSTKQYIKLYENCILAGGIFGATTTFVTYYLPIGKAGVALVSFCIGTFIGSLAVSLAEVLDIMPILARRGKLAFALSYFVLSIALGKLVGSIIYAGAPGFYFN